MADNDGLEKTEQPTGKRLADAREKGQTPRSRELNTLFILLIGSIGMLYMGEHIIGGLSNIIQKNWSLERAVLLDTATLTLRLKETVFDALSILMPLFILLTIVAIFAPMLVSGWNFSTKALEIKLEKFNVIKGLAKLFSLQGTMELLKALGKFIIVACVAFFIMSNWSDSLLQIGNEPLEIAMSHVAHKLIWAFIILSASLILIALIDVPFQVWNHKRQLKMTRQEIKDELKQSDGSPEVKQRVRKTQLEIAKRRMMEEVPKADVIITNPTHFAVALRYNQDSMSAPIVVAKGADLIAFQIRNVGLAHEIPLVSAPMLARAIYFSTQLNKQIPAGLYLVVAQLLAYVYQLKQVTPAEKQYHKKPKFNVPDEYKYEKK